MVKNVVRCGSVFIISCYFFNNSYDASSKDGFKFTKIMIQQVVKQWELGKADLRKSFEAKLPENYQEGY